METRVPYGAPKIRSECLLPFSEGWQQPTADEVRAVVSMAGLTGGDTAKLVGISDGRTVRRWTGGDAPIPFAAWAILCDVAGLGKIWAVPALKINAAQRLLATQQHGKQPGTEAESAAPYTAFQAAQRLVKAQAQSKANSQHDDQTAKATARGRNFTK
ncbi:hypothetical protein [Achromobacter xylosoxidans]|uniref:hypothetical protein n=1 Tax=Alcaligenes xylosoxydans xylosoxydans TaxID=85698 RepID=UPI002FC3AAEB